MSSINNKGFIVELYSVNRKHLYILKKSKYWDRLRNELYWVQNLVVDRDFSFLHNAHTSSGPHPASYSVGTEVKATESSPSIAEVKNEWNCILTTHRPTWHEQEQLFPFIFMSITGRTWACGCRLHRYRRVDSSRKLVEQPLLRKRRTSLFGFFKTAIA